MRSWSALAWRALALALAALWSLAVVSFAVPARADDAVLTEPRDVPLVLQPQAVTVPPVPASFQERDLGWLHLSYAPAARDRVQPLLAGADAVKRQLEEALGQPVLAHVEVRVARSFEDMSELAPVEIGVPAYASGVAYSGLHLVLLTLTAPRTNEAVDLAEVFRHELAHVALEDAVLDHHVPRWFNEGLALYLSGENRLARTQTLWNATLSRTVLPLADLDRSFPEDHYEVSVAYAESADFVRFLLRDADRERFTAFVARTRQGEPFDRALADAYGTDLRKLEFQWREEIAKRYTFLPVLTGGSLLWVLVIGALAYGWIKKRRRAKETLARWGREEAAVEAAAAAARSARAARLASPFLRVGEGAFSDMDLHARPVPPIGLGHGSDPDEARAGQGDRGEGSKDQVSVGRPSEGARLHAVPSGAPPMVRPVSVPMVEHDGSWHTLH